jgi:type II secretory ATPase GspE/PulE/Tfp pilus assembly ATPase PilB-like protein
MSQTQTQAPPDDQLVTKLLNGVLSEAIAKQASDIHLEPRDRHLRVRFRIDGMLVEQQPLPKTSISGVIGRVKVLAQLDVAEKRLPQDGGFSVNSGANGSTRFRVSTLPTDYGEKICLRLLSQRGTFLELGRLGMSAPIIDRLRVCLEAANGVVLVTGPTGSGKTSTLYSMLRMLDAKSRHVITLEDPIEIRFPDIVQTQISPKSGYTFSSGLRAVLRQDPDIIMVGEMRDQETADIALKAGLTGHLVISSLHTNGAIDTFMRLIDMGLERFVVASAVRAIVCQRLIRQLCPECRAEVQPDQATLAILHAEGGPARVHVEKGCERCDGTGFRGRTAIFELVEVDDELADLVKSEKTSRADYKELLARRGVGSLRAAGLVHVRAGTTSLKEVLRVT